MDAPQISVWATLGVASALWLSGTTGGLVKWLLLCVPGVSVVLCVFVGSRQGVIGCGLAILLTSIVTLTGRSGMRRVAFMAVAIAIAVASGFLYWDKLDAEQRNNITSRFLVLG